MASFVHDAVLEVLEIPISLYPRAILRKGSSIPPISLAPKNQIKDLEKSLDAAKTDTSSMTFERDREVSRGF